MNFKIINLNYILNKLKIVFYFDSFFECFESLILNYQKNQPTALFL